MLHHFWDPLAKNESITACRWMLRTFPALLHLCFLKKSTKQTFESTMLPCFYSFSPLSGVKFDFPVFPSFVQIITEASLRVSPPVILSFCLRVTVSPSCCSSCWNTPLRTSSGDVCARLYKSQIWLLCTDLTKCLQTREEDSNDEKKQWRRANKRLVMWQKLNKIRCFMWFCSLMEQRHCAKARIKDTCAFLVSS